MIVVPNSQKDVFLCTYDVNYDDGTYKTKALNSKNEEIFTENEQIEAVSCVDENGNLRYNQNVLKMFAYVDKALLRMNEILHLHEPSPNDVNVSYNIENEINNFRNSLKMKNFEAVNAKKYAYQDGIYYMDIIAACERMGDYILNVVQAVTDKKLK